MSGTTERDIAVAILAGGESRRMGRDKAVLELDGQTLLERTIDVAHAVSDVVAVVGRSPTGDADQAARWLEDDQPDLGPIGGLQTALAHLQRPTILLGCDMPLVDQAALEWLIDRWRESDARHGLATERRAHHRSDHSTSPPPRGRCLARSAARGGGGSHDTDSPHRPHSLEPLFSVYLPTVATLVDDMIAEGRRSLTGLIERGEFGRAKVPREIAEKLVNVNTPEEFEELHQ